MAWMPWLSGRFLIMGAPGAGKGTVSSWLVRDFELPHLAAGDMIRSEMSKQTRNLI